MNRSLLWFYRRGWALGAAGAFAVCAWFLTPPYPFSEQGTWTTFIFANASGALCLFAAAPHLFGVRLYALGSAVTACLIRASSLAFDSFIANDVRVVGITLWILTAYLMIAIAALSIPWAGDARPE